MPRQPIHHVCTSLDVLLHGHALASFEARRSLDAAVAPPPMRAIGERQFFWDNGQTIRIAFIEPGANANHIQRVKDIAVQWLDHANLKFDWVQRGDQPHITIAFSQAAPGTYNSYIGTYSRTQFPSMNLAFQASLKPSDYQNLILHEFGHALGLHHEHQNPKDNKIRWNVAAVRTWFHRNQPTWSDAMITTNVLKRLEADSSRYEFTPYDDKSIMLYEFPASWTIDGYSTHRSSELSDTDKTFIGQLYPKPGGPGTTRKKLKVDGPAISGSLSGSGDVNVYTLEIAEADIYQLETSGFTDVVMMLHGPDDENLLKAQDDDTGEAKNARIIEFLQPGSYTVKIRVSTFVPGIHGDYKVSIKRIAG